MADGTWIVSGKYDMKNIESIKKEKPNGIKGDFILSTFITSTMGVSYKIKLNR